MDLLPTEEQQQIIDTAANFLASEFPVNATPRSALQAVSPPLQQFAELGWLGIGLAEEYGGVGYGLPEETLLFVEMGRNLLSPGIMANVLAARVAAIAGAEELLVDLLAGNKSAALALPQHASPLAIGKVVQGEFLLYDAEHADVLLMTCDSGAALLEQSQLATATTHHCIDHSVTLSGVTVAEVPALAYVSTPQDNIYFRGALLTAAMLLGIAEACRDRSVAFAKEREQFGKPIGSFQAIKHYCADMAVRCESVRALLYHTCVTLQNDSAVAPFDLYALKALATEAAENNANCAVQIHGGMGFTQELDIHLFVKRAQLLSTLFGSKRQHLAKLLAEPAPEQD